MRFLRRLVSITPLKLSFVITLVFLFATMLYDINPELIPVISTVAQKSLDYKFRIRGIQRPKNKIVVVAGDERSFTKFGQWPFDRATVFAPLLETLCKFGTKTVGLDMVWSESEKLMTPGIKTAVREAMGAQSATLDQILAENSGDRVLKKAIESCGPKIVLGYAMQHHEEGGEEEKAEFEKRLKTLIAGGNMLTAKMSSNIQYPDRRGSGAGNVDFYFLAKSGILNNPGLTPTTAAQGFFNNEEDNDGNYRHAMFFWRVRDYIVPSLALRMASKVFGGTTPHVTMIADSDTATRDLALTMTTGQEEQRRLPIDSYGQAIVNYRGPNNTFPVVSMADVISPNETIEYDQIEPTGESKHYKVHKSEFFKDASVIIGITAMALYDIRPRPLDPSATGVENHVNILDNILADDFLLHLKGDMQQWVIAACLFVGLLFGFIISKLDAKFGALFAAGSITGLLYFDQVYLFNNRGIVFAGQLQAIALVAQYIGITVLKFMQEEHEKRFIRSAFDKYVSPAVINSMLKDPGKLKLGGDKKELTVLFSDIRGFTELSEKVDVKTLTAFLNEYLGSMTDILQANMGTLDKYIGDAVMGFWGAPIDLPNHASLAVKTAVEMMIKLEALNAEFQKKYGLTIDIGIGINSGPVSVGNFGSSKVFEYTVIGDNVNLASRLEGINKYYGTHIIISETTYALLKQGEFLTREVDTVKVKGKQKPVKIYEVFPDNITHEPLKNSLKTFNEGLMLYYARQWEKAMTFFNTVLKTRDGDRPTLELIERCKHYIANPPEADWDGSWEMHSK